MLKWNILKCTNSSENFENYPPLHIYIWSKIALQMMRQVSIQHHSVYLRYSHVQSIIETIPNREGAVVQFRLSVDIWGTVQLVLQGWDQETECEVFCDFSYKGYVMQTKSELCLVCRIFMRKAIAPFWG